ncbi:HAMP domain-containing histidine kinase [Clostridium sp. Sa3CUN1]|uniref:histidine kinase n=1 Tax=Clostridium gallinarum TaxID=2762246 RepID=A0ABR8Q246_9CLOT|nr:HAMP domain-containing sensor histidine kinase [Clostridium gallinarum]MBD7914474.1 HAMP domain-containing histidine kinase [Clostridium gallinarum]
MVTIRKKYGLVLLLIFLASTIFFNLLMDNFFKKEFKKLIKNDMENIYHVSSKNLEDYMTLNSIEKSSINIKSFDNKMIRFLAERINTQGVFYDLNGEVISTGTSNENIIDLNIIKDLPASFDEVKNNKTILDIESKNGSMLGKLSIPIYRNYSEQIGTLVLIKDYSEEYIRNTSIKKLVNSIVLLLFLAIFISIYFILSQIIKPIIFLKDKLSEISIGTYPEKIENKSNDEIGVLIDSFNNMSERLKIKDEQEKNIFRNITHELKTPLTNISGYAQILRSDDFNDEEFKRSALDRIISESNRMHEMVVSLLNISKQSSDLKEYSFEEVNIKNIIEELLIIKYPKIIKRKLKVISNIGKETIKGNKQYLTILFSNLIDNGIKYSYENTNITLESKEYNETFEFSILTKGRRIPVEFKDKIFDPFIKIEEKGFSSKDSNGLGLYICKNIVLGHRGKIEVLLNNDETKFIVNIPKD